MTATVLASLGGIGGILAVLTAIIYIGRGVFRQVNATEQLTSAVAELSKTVRELQGTLGSHETRITVLEDRLNRRGISRN